MTLASLSVRDVRCIERADLEISPGVTLIYGDNGSGKTSLLESIFLLGRGRSFRTRNTERLIRRGQDQLRVVGHVDRREGFLQPVGVECGPGGTVARVAGHPVTSLAELSHVFSVQVIEPGVHRLLEEGGHRRRRWLDWAVFHVEPGFVETWVRYTRAVRQHNAALKADPQQAQAWEPELARTGEAIAASRAGFLEQLQPYWQATVAALTDLDVQLSHHRGWNADRTLAEALEASRARDALRHQTHAGPHRADIAVRLGGRPARDVLSRGQQKLVAVAMTLAQLQLLKALSGAAPTLLLDDPAAELDAGRLASFIEQIVQLRTQLIMTSLSAESRLFGAPERVFYVARGRVQPV